MKLSHTLYLVYIYISPISYKGWPRLSCCLTVTGVEQPRVKWDVRALPVFIKPNAWDRSFNTGRGGGGGRYKMGGGKSEVLPL